MNKHHDRFPAVIGAMALLVAALAGTGVSRAFTVVARSRSEVSVGGKRLNEASSWLTAAIHEVHLLASDGASGDIFGSSVAVSGDTAVVGARSDDTSARFAGSAYVFVRSGGLTSQQAPGPPS